MVDNSPAWQDALAVIAAAPHPPRPWRDGTQLPWDDPAFSARVLPVHLDDATHMASRSGPVIARHVAWLRQLVLGRAATAAHPRLVDLACGPGLYCLPLARAGWQVTGLDFAPAAIAHARAAAAAAGATCTYVESDLTRLAPGDLPVAEVVTFWFGEFHSFPPPAAAALLRVIATALAPGGIFVLEYQPWELFVQADEQQWQVGDRSAFCDGPHLWLQEHAWDADARAEITVHWIVEVATGRLHRYAQCHQAYTWPELVDLLAGAGLVVESHHPPIAGIDPRFEFPVLVAAKPRA
jgi:SAM-dependent methyltransferase